MTQTDALLMRPNYLSWFLWWKPIQNICLVLFVPEWAGTLGVFPPAIFSNWLACLRTKQRSLLWEVDFGVFLQHMWVMSAECASYTSVITAPAVRWRRREFSSFLLCFELNQKALSFRSGANVVGRLFVFCVAAAKVQWWTSPVRWDKTEQIYFHM